MNKRSMNNQYSVGNDREIPDSAFISGSYLDGIYTQFNSAVASGNWTSIQETFKMELPQSEWEFGAIDSATVSGLNESAIFTDQYDKATSDTIIAQFPDFTTSGRGDYVEK